MINEEQDGWDVMGETRLQYLQRKRDQFFMAIPVCLTLFGFVAYGCWQLDATWPETLMVLPLPALMLVIYVFAFMATGRKIQKLTGEEPD